MARGDDFFQNPPLNGGCTIIPGPDDPHQLTTTARTLVPVALRPTHIMRIVAISNFRSESLIEMNLYRGCAAYQAGTGSIQFGACPDGPGGMKGLHAALFSIFTMVPKGLGRPFGRKGPVATV